MINLLTELQEKLAKAKEIGDVKEITVLRGRLINAIKKEIAKISATISEYPEEEQNLKNLSTLLENEIQNHKMQLSGRYKKEFLDEKATVKAIFTVLPHGIKLSIDKVVACINQLKESKTNKEKIFNSLETAKSLGLSVATPAIFTAKFVARHWYLILLLLALLKLKLPSFGLFKNNGKGNEEFTPKEEPSYATNPATETNPAKSAAMEPNSATDLNPAIEPNLNPNTQNELNNGLLNAKDADPASSLSDPHLGPDTTATNLSDMLKENDPNKVFASQEELFSMLKKLAELQNKDNMIFDTYEDAIKYFMENAGMSKEDAINCLNGSLTGNIPSVRWLIGPKGMYSDEQINELSNLTTDEMNEFLNSKQEIIANLLDQQQVGDFSDLKNLKLDFDTILGTLGVAGTLMLLLKLGLAYETGGMSLAF